MQSSEPTASFLLDINQQQCLEITGSSIADDSWQWLPYGSKENPGTVKLEQNNQYSLILYGKTAGSRIDSVMLSKPDCRPVGMGDNCSLTATAEPTSGSEYTILPSPSEQALSGKVQLSNTPKNYQAQLKSLKYTTGGRTMQQFKTAEPFDTTLLSNGSHTILIDTELVDGRQFKESVTIEVKNPSNVLTPVVRWIRINQQTLKTVGIAVVFILLILTLFWMMRRWYLRRRLRNFHGF